MPSESTIVTSTIVPGDPLTRITRAVVILHWKADIKPYQATLATLVAEDPRIAPDVDYPDSALCERTAAAAARAWRTTRVMVWLPIMALIVHMLIGKVLSLAGRGTEQKRKLPLSPLGAR